MGLALEGMVLAASMPKETSAKKDQYRARGLFRQAADDLKAAGFDQDERDRIMKPNQLAYDPKHRTRHAKPNGSGSGALVHADNSK